MTKKGKIWMWSIIGFLVVSVLIIFCFPVFCDISHFERNPYDSLCWFATEVFAYDKVENSDGCTG
ncbi:MAG: hypothetical protein KAH30_01220, partial [Caldisericia bacterium]|nr:hypothetical protein [Caldisericia bacterium]